MSLKESKVAVARTATLSLRTLLMAVAVSAAYFGVFVATSYRAGPYTAVGVVACLVALFILVCATFASIADDFWRDPDVTFVAAIFGFLGYAVMLALGMLFPVAARFIDSGFWP